MLQTQTIDHSLSEKENRRNVNKIKQYSFINSGECLPESLLRYENRHVYSFMYVQHFHQIHKMFGSNQDVVTNLEAFLFRILCKFIY